MRSLLISMLVCYCTCQQGGPPGVPPKHHDGAPPAGHGHHQEGFGVNPHDAEYVFTTGFPFLLCESVPVSTTVTVFYLVRLIVKSIGVLACLLITKVKVTKCPWCISGSHSHNCFNHASTHNL